MARSRSKQLLKPEQLGSHALVIEVTTPMYELLQGLVATGLYGPDEDSAARRLLEQKMFEMAFHVEKEAAKILKAQRKAKKTK